MFFRYSKPTIKSIIIIKINSITNIILITILLIFILLQKIFLSLSKLMNLLNNIKKNNAPNKFKIISSISNHPTEKINCKNSIKHVTNNKTINCNFIFSYFLFFKTSKIVSGLNITKLPTIL